MPFGATADSEACAETADCNVRAEVCGLRICTRYDRLSQQQLSFLLKKVYVMYNEVWGLCPISWGILRIFVLSVTLQSVRLLLTVSYRKIGGAGCTICSPNNFVGGTTAPSAPPIPAPMLADPVNTLVACYH